MANRKRKDCKRDIETLMAALDSDVCAAVNKAAKRAEVEGIPESEVNKAIAKLLRELARYALLGERR